MARKSQLTPRGSAPASLIQGTIDTLTQGVSQQPPHIRQPGQCQEQINAWSSPVSGLQKRRPTTFVDQLSPEPIEDFYAETMPVQSGERYQVYIARSGSDTTLAILNNGSSVNIDVHGTGLSIVSGEVAGKSSSYLWNDVALKKKFVFFNNGPLGFLLNRERIVKMDAALTPAAVNDGILFIQAVAYEITYTVKLDGVALPSYTTPKATDTNNLLSVDIVATELAARINANTNYTATNSSGVVYVKRKDGTDFRLDLSDGRSNTLARSFKGSTAAFSGLPTVAPNGFLLRIENSPDTPRDDYWVKFRTRDGSAFADGSWIEAVAPGIGYKLDCQTMPLIIYRESSNVFFVGPADGAVRTLTVGGVAHTFTFPKWGEREAGDTTSVPTPSFVGERIRDHGIFRSRYAMLAGQNIVVSRVDEVFDFFQQTSSEVLSTDPIDLFASSESSSELCYMLQVDESLLVFAAKSQFQVRPADADVLTPRNAICVRLSNIEMNVDIRPKLCGANVVFSTLEHDYTGFREYQFYDSQNRRIGLNLGGNSSITSNVPKLIPGTADLWDVGESVDYFVVGTPSDPKSLYVYKYLWQSAASSYALTKLQSSWSKWEFDGIIRWARFIDNDLFLIMTYPDGTYTVKIRSEELNSLDNPQYYLDRSLLYPECNQTGDPNTVITATWDQVSDITTFTLPYVMAGDTDIVVRRDNSRSQAVQIGTSSSGGTIICNERGDWRSDKLVVGRRYRLSYTFTTPYKPAPDSGRQRLIGDLSGRLQIATWTTYHSDTGRYDVVVKRKNRQRDTRSEYWARILNVEGNQLDRQDRVLQSGKLRVPIYASNTSFSVTLESDSWLPVTITGATWEGSYNNRARSIG